MLKHISLLTVGIFLFITKSHGQFEFDKTLKPDSCVEEINIWNSEIHPEYPGGKDSLFYFIERNLNFEKIEPIDTSGRSFYMFTIDSIGYPKFDSVMRSLNPEFDREMERIINSMPKWKPGEINGKTVNVGMTIPIKLPYERKFK